MVEIFEYRGFRLQVGPVGKGWRASIYSAGSASALPDSPTNLEKSRKDEIVAEAKRIIDTRLRSRSIRHHQILTRLPCATAPWIAVVVVQAPDVMPVEALISHSHPCTKRVNGGKIFDCETNCLCRRGEATITDRLTQTGFALFWYEQFGRCGVIERHHYGPLRNYAGLS
jgi:hypothetical protein